MMTSIRTAGLYIRGSRSLGESGLFLRRDGLQGWDGLPASRREAVAREMQHGELDLPTWLPSRVVTIDGLIYGDSETDLRKHINQVRAWAAGGVRLTLTVDRLGETLTAWGRRATATVRAIAPDLQRADFQIQAVCADPRQYGEASTMPPAGTSTSIDVLHGGTFPAYPVIEIPGAPSSYTITSPAGSFVVSGATAGGLHRVDMRTGFVTRDGARMPGVGRGALWAVPNDAVWRHTVTAPARVVIIDTFI